MNRRFLLFDYRLSTFLPVVQLIWLSLIPGVQSFIIPHGKPQRLNGKSSNASPLPSSSIEYSIYARPCCQQSSTALFGIKGFRAWFEKQFPNAIVDLPVSALHRQTFDHVLIDMNQMLHIVMRRTRNDEQTMVMLMSELDNTCRLATPTKSLVLAIDGPPAAAKLATQRRRRFGSLVRSEEKMKLMEKFSQRFSERHFEKRMRNYNAEIETLKISPGTEFMKMCEDTLIYWAWQRLQSTSRSYLKRRGVRVYISPSIAPGEGEVKLLDWIYQKQPRGTIAILGGDSDLVLEGLVIPPSLTHNVFVLLPEGKSGHLSVSLWETTRELARLLPNLSPDEILRVRTDMVLLLIMNGNDYLPKLRGTASLSITSSKFSKLFDVYIQLVRTWSRENNGTVPSLVDPIKLEFNLPFCISFFKNLAKDENPSVYTSRSENSRQHAFDAGIAINKLNRLFEMKCLPGPLKWQCYRETVSKKNQTDENLGFVDAEDDTENYNDEGDGDDEDDDDDYDEFNDQDLENNESEQNDSDDSLIREHVILTLGEQGSGEFYEFKTSYYAKKSFRRKKRRRLQQRARNEVASLALEDFLGSDYSIDEEDDDEFGISSSGYAWELRFPVEARVDLYLCGLLWNLQTYQDGICADYAFNYGKRHAPTANELVNFFEKAQSDDRTLNRQSLVSDEFSPPVSAGLSSLAALPTPMKHLVPDPYKRLSSDLVEEIYTKCMDHEDNVFDLKEFERLCENSIKKLELPKDASGSSDKMCRGKQITLGEDFWTVIRRSQEPARNSFTPPKLFSRDLSPLEQDHFIMAGRLYTASKPRTRAVCSDKLESFENKDMAISFGFGKLLDRGLDIMDVPYMTAFRPPPVRTQTSQIGYRSGDKAGRPGKNIAATRKNPKPSTKDIHTKSDVTDTKRLTGNPETSEIFGTNTEATMKGKSAKSETKSSIYIKDITMERNGHNASDDKPLSSNRFGKKMEGRVTGKNSMPASKKFIEDIPTKFDWIGHDHAAEKPATSNTRGKDIEATWDEKKQESTKKRYMEDTPTECEWIDEESDAPIDYIEYIARMEGLGLSYPTNRNVVNPEGCNSLELLNHLEQSNLIGKAQWTFVYPSKSVFASPDPTSFEEVCLTFEREGQVMTYKQDRLMFTINMKQSKYNDGSMHAMKRKQVKRHLASLALRDIVGPKESWTELECSEIKRCFQDG